ncbi:MAG: phenylacetate--CoA ligase [Candidatus Caldarchaeum sp.]
MAGRTQYWEPNIETAGRKEIQELQLKRLKFILRYVYDRSPFYRRRFNEAGVVPDDVKKLDDVRKLPFTTKDDLRLYSYPYGGDFLCVPREELVCWHMTSGTTGKPTVGPYTFKDYETWMNLMARCLVTCGVRKGDIMLNIYGYGLFTGGLGFHQSAHLVGASVIPWSVGRTEALIQALKDFQPTVMTGTPSYNLYIAEQMRKQGLKPNDISLRITINGAEIWTEEARKRIEEGFGLKERGGGAMNIYGATELFGPGSGVECEQQLGFHFWIDHFYLELIDPETLEPVQPGERGEMVVTTLTKEGMPLIRYRMRDITVLDDSGCGCGRDAFPRCKWITGRVDDVIHYKGAKIWPSTIQETLLKFPEVLEYQVLIDKSSAGGQFIIRIELDKEKDGMEKRETLVSELRKNLLFVTPHVEFVPEGTLPRYEGKSKRIIVKEMM